MVNLLRIKPFPQTEVERSTTGGTVHDLYTVSYYKRLKCHFNTWLYLHRRLWGQCGHNAPGSVAVAGCETGDRPTLWGSLQQCDESHQASVKASPGGASSFVPLRENKLHKQNFALRRFILKVQELSDINTFILTGRERFVEVQNRVEKVGPPSSGPVCFCPAVPKIVYLLLPILHNEHYQSMAGNLVAGKRRKVGQSLEEKLLNVLTTRAERQAEDRRHI